MNQDRACFKKNSSLHIWAKNFRTTFFRDCTPKSTIFYPSKILMTIFLVITFFYDFLALHMSCLNPKFSQHKLLHDLFCIFLICFTIFCPSVFFAHYAPLICTPACCFHVSAPCFVLL